jgi:hypothetical protein
MTRLAGLGSSLFASICILALILGVASTTPNALGAEPLNGDCADNSGLCWDDILDICHAPDGCPGTGGACKCFIPNGDPDEESDCLCVPFS